MACTFTQNNWLLIFNKCFLEQACSVSIRGSTSKTVHILITVIIIIIIVIITTTIIIIMIIIIIIHLYSAFHARFKGAAYNSTVNIKINKFNKNVTVQLDLISHGREFHRSGAATEKAHFT